MPFVCVHHQNIAVSETLCDWGETLCAACPNSSTVITAGTSTVVCVWDVAVSKDKLSHMKLRQVSLNVTVPWVYLNKHTLTYTVQYSLSDDASAVFRSRCMATQTQ